MSRKRRQDEDEGQAQSAGKKGSRGVVSPRAEARYWEVLLLLLAILALCIGLRLLEAPEWGARHFQVQGEKLMATHDAYFGLANAKGAGRDPDQSLAQVLNALHSVTGVDRGNIAFWLPALFAPLAGLPIVFLALRWRLIEAGLAAGVLTAGCLGFFLRTRLGFFDNDVLTLLFPVVLLCGLIIWLESRTVDHWRDAGRGLPSEPDKQDIRLFLLSAIFLGLLGAAYVWFRSAGNSFVIAFFLIAVVLGLLLPRTRRDRGTILLGLLVFYGVSLAGWVGLLVGLGLLIVSQVRPRLLENTRNLILLIACLAVFFVFYTNFHLQFLNNLERILSYTKFSVTEAVHKEPVLDLPAIKQSVREAQNIAFNQIINRVAGNWPLFILGLLGYGYLVFKRPLALLFLPFLGLGLASYQMGNRFTMYGGTAMGAGLAFGISLLLIRGGVSKPLRWVVQIVICFAVIWPMWNVASKVGPAPILPKEYAQTFIDLKDKASPQARLWQWWDYGYAAQYYAERATFGDGGGRYHKGPFLYPLAKVHMAHSPQQAAQLMRFVTSSQREQYTEHPARFATSPEMWRSYLPDPLARLRALGPEQAQAFVESLASEEQDWPEDLPPQYLVVSWENMMLAYWISYYGTWDLQNGRAEPGKIQRVKGNARFDLQKGLLEMADGRVELSGLDVIEKQGSRHFDWPNGTGVYAVLNRAARELYLMDSTIYRSVMVQMLVREPERFQEHFELVVDRSPWARAYLVK